MAASIHTHGSSSRCTPITSITVITVNAYSAQLHGACHDALWLHMCIYGESHTVCHFTVLRQLLTWPVPYMVILMALVENDISWSQLCKPQKQQTELRYNSPIQLYKFLRVIESELKRLEGVIKLNTKLNHQRIMLSLQCIDSVQWSLCQVCLN